MILSVQNALDEPRERTGSSLQKVIERFLAANFPPHLRARLTSWKNSCEAVRKHRRREKRKIHEVVGMLFSCSMPESIADVSQATSVFCNSQLLGTKFRNYFQEEFEESFTFAMNKHKFG